MKSGYVQLVEKCNNCQRSNHFAKMCKRQKIHAVAENFESSGTVTEYDQYFVQSVECIFDKGKYWKIVVEFCGKKLEMKLDTRAQVNVLPYKV